MPVYNKRAYLRKAVESVLAQTFGDWELVMVENGSTDGSDVLAASFDDPRITLLRQAHTGVSAARNSGVAHSAAPWVCFLDADDWWEPTFLEEMAGLTDRHPGAGLYTTRYYIVKNSVRRLAPHAVGDTFAEGEIDYFRCYADTLCMPLCVGSVCMPRRLFDELRGFRTDLHLGEDFDLWVRIALRHSVVLLNRPLFNYNQDVAKKYRSTQQLHPPQHHFLWHVDYPDAPESFKVLIDRLTAYNLLPYYLSRKYHDATLPLLDRVDWAAVPEELHRPYLRPLWWERLRECLMRAGAAAKGWLGGSRLS